MSNDVRIVSNTNGLLAGNTWPSPAHVAGSYKLVQQIYKCLQTNLGEDTFDPTYGSGLRSGLLGVPGQNLIAASSAATSALKQTLACLSNPSETDPSAQLVNLGLISIAYDPAATAWVMSVQVTTGAGSFALPVSSVS